jgi:hypothetical protein
VLTFNIILFVFLFLMLLGSLHKRYQLKNQVLALNEAAEDVDKALATLKDIAKQKKKNQDLADPVLLSTIITVIVSKYGNVQLGIEDFANVPDGEYVSLYVDIEEQNLILSTDHSMSQADPINMLRYTNSDDNTFH